MADDKDLMVAEPEGAEAQELYEKVAPEDDVLEEQKPEGETEEVEEEDLNLEEYGLDPKRKLGEQLKELNPKEMRVFKEKLERLQATFPKLGIADVDHLIELAEKHDPRAQAKQPKAEAAKEVAAREFALGDWSKTYNEDSRKFANELAKDLLTYVKGELSKGGEEDGRFEEIGEGIYSVADDQWYFNHLMKDMVGETEKKLGVSRARMQKEIKDMGPEWLARVRANGKNPYELISRMMGNGAPAAPALKTGGIDKAKEIERPGSSAGEGAIRLIKNGDGSIDWKTMIKKYGDDRVEALYMKMFPQK